MPPVTPGEWESYIQVCFQGIFNRIEVEVGVNMAKYILAGDWVDKGEIDGVIHADCGFYDGIYAVWVMQR